MQNYIKSMLLKRPKSIELFPKMVSFYNHALLVLSEKDVGVGSAAPPSTITV